MKLGSGGSNGPGAGARRGGVILVDLALPCSALICSVLSYPAPLEMAMAAGWWDDEHDDDRTLLCICAEDDDVNCRILFFFSFLSLDERRPVHSSHTVQGAPPFFFLFLLNQLGAGGVAKN